MDGPSLGLQNPLPLAPEVPLSKPLSSAFELKETESRVWSVFAEPPSTACSSFPEDIVFVFEVVAWSPRGHQYAKHGKHQNKWSHLCQLHILGIYDY